MTARATARLRGKKRPRDKMAAMTSSFLSPVNGTRISRPSQGVDLAPGQGLLYPGDLEHDLHNYSMSGGMDMMDSPMSSVPPNAGSKGGGSSIIEGKARVALSEQFLVHNAVLLSVACVGALLLLVVNMVGVVFCRGYFKKKARPSFVACCQNQPVSYSRRSHYSAIDRMSNDAFLNEPPRQEALKMEPLACGSSHGSTAPHSVGGNPCFRPANDQRQLETSLDERSGRGHHRSRQADRKWRDRFRLNCLPFKTPREEGGDPRNTPVGNQGSSQEHSRRARASLGGVAELCPGPSVVHDHPPHGGAAISIPVASTSSVDVFPALVVHWGNDRL